MLVNRHVRNHLVEVPRHGLRLRTGKLALARLQRLGRVPVVQVERDLAVART
jgi:hypothetical protein